MESIKIRKYIGNDGILQIQLPPEIVNQEFRCSDCLSTCYQRILTVFNQNLSELRYSQRFVEEVIGSLEGDPLEHSMAYLLDHCIPPTVINHGSV